MPGQVSPNFGMTRLPDVTTQREIAPARTEFDNQALMNLAIQFPDLAAPVISSIKNAKDLTKQDKADLIKIGRGEVVYDPVKNEYVAQGLAEQPKPVDVGGDLDAQSLADYNKSFNDIGPQERQAVINKVNSERTNRAKASAVQLPPAAKSVLAADEKTIEGLFANANSARTIASQTRNINSLLGSKPGGGLIKLSADAQNFLGIKSPEAGVNQAVQALATQAAVGIRTPGSGSTSDLEFNAYRAVFPSLATSNEGRQLMSMIAEANAKRMSKLADWARTNIKNDTFTYEGLADFDNSLGRAVSADIDKRVKALTGAKGSASGWSAEEVK
jgi:hypothetical protein